MRIKNTDIPQAAIDAGLAAMVPGFTAGQIQAAVSVVLRADPEFSYPDASKPSRMDGLDLRVADSLIQSARKRGEIVFGKGRWTLTAKS